MPPEKLVQHGPLGDDEARAWTGEKRRKYVAPPSSHAPGTAQDSHVTDMDIIQGLPPRSDSGQEEEELWGPEVDISDEEMINYERSLAPNFRPPIDPDSWVRPTMNWEEFRKVQERLARHRITYYKIAKPDSGCELKDPAEYSPDELYKELYFERLEDKSFEWYFHPKDSRIRGLNDYQRLVVSDVAHDTSDRQYLFWDDYRTRYHTYETDAVYVKYYGELSKKVKWIEGYLDLDCMSEEWKKMGGRAWKQALKIATSFPQMTIDLVSFAHTDFIWEMRMDALVKDLDLVYFEIWKRVTKQNRSFREAVEEVLGTHKFPSHKGKMEAELNGSAVYTMESWLKDFVAEGGISVNAGENEARNLFREIVFRKLKKKNMADYASRKMEIADRMNLVPSYNLVGPHPRRMFPGPSPDRIQCQKGGGATACGYA